MPLGIKRKILQELEKGCPTYANRPEKQKEILEEYKQYLDGVIIIRICDTYILSYLDYYSIHLKKLSGTVIP